jgi:peptide/nickel transport system ATP-binding protein
MTEASSGAIAPLLEVRELRVQFAERSGQVPAVDGLSFRHFAGRTLAIVGESGSGKTASCRALMGLLPRSAAVTGSVRLNGKELVGLGERELRRHRGADIAMVFQDPARSLNPTMRVGAQIAEAVRIHAQLDRHAARTRAIDLMRMLELPAPEQQFFAHPHELSGGMQQRVAIAIAVACNPKVLIADEATKSLDVRTQARILDLLTELKRQLGMALIMVTHDLRVAATLADHVLVMRAGRLIESVPADGLFRNAQHPHAKALLAAVPGRGSASARSGGRPRDSRELVLEARDIVQEFNIRDRDTLNHHRIVHAVSGVSLDLYRGETLGLVGETGCGKSTLARALLQIPPPKSGAVVFRGRDLTQMRGRGLIDHRRRLQMVFQEPFGSLNAKWRVSSIVEEPLLGFGVGDLTARRRKVSEMLERVGLRPAVYGRRRPSELSGGECQRVAIARALAPEPDVIVCDEAVASLDALAQTQVLALLSELRGELGLSYIFISHDVDIVNAVSDRVAVMHGGRICEIGPTAAIYERAAHPYTAKLLASLPSVERSTATDQPADFVRGDPPSPTDPPSGCRFRTRCLRAAERCSLEAPPLRSIAQDHLAACHFPLTNSRETP